MLRALPKIDIQPNPLCVLPGAITKHFFLNRFRNTQFCPNWDLGMQVSYINFSGVNQEKGNLQNDPQTTKLMSKGISTKGTHVSSSFVLGCESVRQSVRQEAILYAKIIYMKEE